VLLPLFSWIFPCVHNSTYTKYCSIENFIKLPFQQVLIHLNRSPNEGVMTVLFPHLHAVQKISEHATFGNSAIPACRNLWLTWFSIRWKCNGAYKYPKISCFSPLWLCRNWWEHKPLVNWSEYVDDLDLVVSGALHRVSFGFKSSPLLDQRVAWWQWCVFFMILL
jgi:hypothetical protein